MKIKTCVYQYWTFLYNFFGGAAFVSFLEGILFLVLMMPMIVCLKISYFTFNYVCMCVFMWGICICVRAGAEEVQREQLIP